MNNQLQCDSSRNQLDKIVSVKSTEIIVEIFGRKVTTICELKIISLGDEIIER